MSTILEGNMNQENLVIDKQQFLGQPCQVVSMSTMLEGNTKQEDLVIGKIQLYVAVLLGGVDVYNFGRKYETRGSRNWQTLVFGAALLGGLDVYSFGRKYKTRGPVY